LPADGGVDADAECSGEDCRGDLGGELKQCGAAGLDGADVEPIQSEFEPLGADRAAGLAAGEQPTRRSGGADGGVALALGDDGAGELVDGVGHSDRCLAEGDPNVSVGDGDLVGGEQADRGRALRVEEQEQAGETVLDLDRGVVQQFPGGFPSVIIVERVDPGLLTQRRLATDAIGVFPGSRLFMDVSLAGSDVDL
jgi:hypothetical protein